MNMLSKSSELNLNDLENEKYRKMQQYCKKHGLNAKGTKEELIDRISNANKSDCNDTDMKTIELIRCRSIPIFPRETIYVSSLESEKWIDIHRVAYDSNSFLTFVLSVF